MTTFITVERAAPALDMTPAQIWRLIREEKFPWPFVRCGKLIRIDARAIGLTAMPAGSTGEQKDEGGEIETPDANQ